MKKLSNSSDEGPQNDLEQIGQDKETGYSENLSEEDIIKQIETQLEEEKEKSSSYEKKIQYLLADYENLKKRSEIDIQNRVNSKIDQIILKFLDIYDDFVRAREAISKQNINTQGLDAILKNMDSFLYELGVIPIDAIGEVFDPKLHEAISIRKDPSLDENVITAELRKGYILKDRVIRPSLVEISKRHIMETNTNG